jgi:hypothetical protein
VRLVFQAEIGNMIDKERITGTPPPLCELSCKSLVLF